MTTPTEEQVVVDHDGRWRIRRGLNKDFRQSSVDEIKEVFNRISGENVRLKRQITSLKQENASGNQNPAQAVDTDGNRRRGWTLILLGVVLGVFASAILAFFATLWDWMNGTEIKLTPSLILVLFVLYLIARWAYVRYQSVDNGKAKLSERLSSYGNSRKANFRKDHVKTGKKTQSKILGWLKDNFWYNRGQTHRGGES